LSIVTYQRKKANNKQQEIHILHTEFSLADLEKGAGKEKNYEGAALGFDGC